MAKKRSEKMFGRMIRKKREAPVAINVYLDCPTYDRFRAYVTEKSLNESNALIKVIERGMANYWLYGYKQLKQNYHLRREIFEKYKKDNEVLNAIRQQNEKLQNLLAERTKQNVTTIHTQQDKVKI